MLLVSTNGSIPYSRPLLYVSMWLARNFKGTSWITFGCTEERSLSVSTFPLHLFSLVFIGSQWLPVFGPNYHQMHFDTANEPDHFLVHFWPITFRSSHWLHINPLMKVSSDQKHVQTVGSAVQISTFESFMWLSSNLCFITLFPPNVGSLTFFFFQRSDSYLTLVCFWSLTKFPLLLVFIYGLLFASCATTLSVNYKDLHNSHCPWSNSSCLGSPHMDCFKKSFEEL